MAGDTVITVIGNLTADPELRFTPSGAAVANFTVASTPRTFDRQSNEWKDGETLFLRCSVWREAAENVAESLQKGMRVIVQGRLKSRSYETKEGERRTVTPAVRPSRPLFRGPSWVDHSCVPLRFSRSENRWKPRRA
jgi:single-strand DNA-binding protein